MPRQYKKRSEQEWHAIIDSYLAQPPKKRKRWLTAHGVHNSVFYRNAARLGRPIERGATASTVKTAPRPVVLSNGHSNGHSKQPRGQALIAQLQADNTLLRGLLQKALEAGFLDHFFSLAPIPGVLAALGGSLSVSSEE